MRKQFYESDYAEAISHREWLNSLIVTLTNETEVRPAEGFEQAIVEFEDPAIARARVAVALGLMPIDVAVKEGILEKFDGDDAVAVGPGDKGVRLVDNLALRMRERLYPNDYDRTYTRVIQVVPGLTSKETQQLPSSLSGVGQETIITPHPGALDTSADPLFDRLKRQTDDANAPAAALGDAETTPVKGPLPEDFPGYTSLGALDPPVHTYHQVRKLIGTGPNWYKDIEGIGKATAEKAEAAANAAPPDEE